MSEFLDDPSVLTKDKLKSELLAHNVELPSGNPTKDVYVQLYLKNLTAQNNKHVTATTLDAFSSDEELPPPVVSSRSRSSGRKATRKTDKVWPDELDVTLLTDQALKDELLKHGVDVGPIVASTRKLYEKKLQKLLDDGPAQPPLPQLIITEIITEVNHNGNSESDMYSDKEDEVTAAPEPEPVSEPEPAPVVERPLRSRGKTSVTTRSSQNHMYDVLTRNSYIYNKLVPEDLSPTLSHQVQLHSNRKVHYRQDSPAWAEPRSTSSRLSQLQEEELRLCLPKPSEDPVTLLNTALLEVEKITASSETLKVEKNDVLKELMPNDLNSPTGITATCRRPIRGAADRPVKSSGLWDDENSLLSPKTTKMTSSYMESRTVNRVASLPPSASFNSSTSSFSTSSSRHLSAATPAGQTKAATRNMSLWIKLFLLAVVAAFLFLVYQAMETNTINPFNAPDTEVASGSTA